MFSVRTVQCSALPCPVPPRPFPGLPWPPYPNSNDDGKNSNSKQQQAGRPQFNVSGTPVWRALDLRWKFTLCKAVRRARFGPPTPCWRLSAAVSLLRTAQDPLSGAGTDPPQRAENHPKRAQSPPPWSHLNGFRHIAVRLGALGGPCGPPGLRFLPVWGRVWSVRSPGPTGGCAGAKGAQDRSKCKLSNVVSGHLGGSAERILSRFGPFGVLLWPVFNSVPAASFRASGGSSEAGRSHTTFVD